MRSLFLGILGLNGLLSPILVALAAAHEAPKGAEVPALVIGVLLGLLGLVGWFGLRDLARSIWEVSDRGEPAPVVDPELKQKMGRLERTVELLSDQLDRMEKLMKQSTPPKSSEAAPKPEAAKLDLDQIKEGGTKPL